VIGAIMPIWIGMGRPFASEHESTGAAADLVFAAGLAAPGEHER